MLSPTDFIHPTSFSLDIPQPASRTSRQGHSNTRPPSPESESFNLDPREDAAQQQAPPAEETAIEIPTQSSEQTGPSIIHLKNASFLRKFCAFLIFIALGVFTSLQETRLEQALDHLFLIASYSLIYIIFEDILIPPQTQPTPEHRKDHIFNTLDWILLLYFLLALNLQHYGKMGRYLILGSPVLSFTLTSSYVKLSLANSSWKNTKMILRVFTTLQVSLISARMTGYVKFSWLTIFMPSVVYFGCYALCGLYATIKSLAQIPRRIAEGEPLRLLIIASLIKTSWYVLYYGLSILALVILVTICKQGNNRETTKLLLNFAGYYSSFLLGYTLAFIRLIQKFNINLDIHSSEDLELFQEFAGEEPGAPERTHSLKPEENPSTFYFKKASSTYFIKIDDKPQDSQDSKSTAASDLTMPDMASTTNESLCYICEMNQSNTILMDCGHGGMCIDCAKESILKKNSCMECRRPIGSIYQIDKEDKIHGHVEATQVLTVVC